MATLIMSEDERDACELVIKRLRRFAVDEFGPRYGNKASRTLSREQLIQQHEALTGDAPFPDPEEGVHVTLIQFMCPPCVVPTQQLRPMLLADLKFGKPHRGRVLILRSVVTPKRLSATFFVVEDAAGTVDRLMVYEHATRTTALELLPAGSLIAVKEPCFHYTPEGLVVRVDSQTNIEQLPADHSMLPECFKSSGDHDKTNAEACKIEGNAAYRAGSYRQAAVAYTQGISLCDTSNVLLKADLYRNRAIVNNKLGNHNEAIEDAKACHLSPEAPLSADKINALNSKAFRQAGLAHYARRDFKLAKNQFAAALKLTPDDQSAIRERARTLQRLTERSTGTYDFDKLAATVTEGNARLDIADYKVKIQVRVTSKDTYEIFASVPIKRGDVVLVEKAWASSYLSDGKVRRTVQPMDGEPLFGVYNTLADQVYEKVRDQPSLAARLAELHAGEPRGPVQCQTVQGERIVDYKVLHDFIVDHAKYFPAISALTFSRQAHGGPMQQHVIPSTNGLPYGLWVTGRHIKHACNGNCLQSFIGDVSIFTALRNIAAGERLTQVEFRPSFSYAETMANLEQVGVACACNVCLLEKDLPISTHAKRTQLLTRFATMPSGRHCTWYMLKLGELVDEMKETYSPALYRDGPRLALFPVYLPLAAMYAGFMTRSTAFEHYCSAFDACGIKVTVHGDNVRIDCSNIVWTVTLIDCAKFTADLLIKDSKPQMARAFRELALDLYRAHSGQQEQGFDSYRTPQRETEATSAPSPQVAQMLREMQRDGCTPS